MPSSITPFKLDCNGFYGNDDYTKQKEHSPSVIFPLIGTPIQTQSGETVGTNTKIKNCANPWNPFIHQHFVIIAYQNSLQWDKVRFLPLLGYNTRRVQASQSVPIPQIKNYANLGKPFSDQNFQILLNQNQHRQSAPSAILPHIRIQTATSRKTGTGHSCRFYQVVWYWPICRYQTEPMLMGSDQLQLVKEMT